ISPLPYLHQNYPNPFSHSTIIRFDLPEVAKVKIEIFNHFGQKIETLLDKPMPAGLHEVDFSAGNLPGGVYLYKIIANSNEESFELIQVKKMVVVK
nr:T9SS type A sorting domain-containing protein [Bacteroidota bacterium]